MVVSMVPPQLPCLAWMYVHITHSPSNTTGPLVLSILQSSLLLISTVATEG